MTLELMAHLALCVFAGWVLGTALFRTTNRLGTTWERWQWSFAGLFAALVVVYITLWR